jgi:hypothetical protein
MEISTKGDILDRNLLGEATSHLRWTNLLSIIFWLLFLVLIVWVLYQLAQTAIQQVETLGNSKPQTIF